MMRPKGIFYFAALLLLIASCQADTKKPADQKQKEKKTIRYFVQYLESDRLIRAEARFYDGENIDKAPLLEMNTVSFQGGSMELTSAPKEAFVYKTERPGDFHSKMKFQYSLEKEEGLIDVHLSPIESFLIKDRVSQSKGFTLVWDGRPLVEGEELLLFFADQANKAASSTLRGPTSKSEVQMGGTFLSELQAGKGKLFLVRKKKGKQADQHTTHEFELAYYTRPIGIDIIP